MLKDYLLSKKFLFRFFIFIIIFAHIVFAFKNLTFFLQSMSLGFGFIFSYRELFDIRNTFDIFTFTIAMLTIVFSAYNFALIIEFLKQQKSVMNTNGGVFSISFIIALIGTHCASCGAALFGGFISLSGLSVLPFAGKEIGLLGVILLLWSSYIISKKVNNPWVC